MGVAKLGALVLLGVGLAGVMGPGCSNRAEDPALNGEGVRGSVPVNPINEMMGGGGGGMPAGGGGGTSVACLENPGCLPTDGICGAGMCTDGKCVFTVKPLASDLYGDCHKTLCDAQGKVVLVEDDTTPNAYDDGNSCTKDTCMNGTSLHQVVSGSMCPLDSGATGVCDSNGLCVECLSEIQCNNSHFPICKAGKCVALQCVNGKFDTSEAGLDCGGPDCGPCPAQEMCGKVTDCQSLVCRDGGGINLCFAPTCTDSVKNGKETDVDCGGSLCQPVGRLCSNGKRCALATDCQSGVCKQGTCQAPSCTDGVKNGNETGIDCGGACGAVPCLPPL